MKLACIALRILHACAVHALSISECTCTAAKGSHRYIDHVGSSVLHLGQLPQLRSAVRTIAMKASFSTLLLLSLSVLRAACQVPPYRYGATVLRDSCPSADDVASQPTEPTMSSVLSNIATRIANRTGVCVCARIDSQPRGSVRLTIYGMWLVLYVMGLLPEARGFACHHG